MTSDHDFKKFLQTVGTNLHALRVKHDLKIETVAKAVKISRHLLRRIEKGQHNMRIESLERLCLFYKVTARDIATEKKTTDET